MHDVWGNGLTGDPVAAVISGQQHVWAVGSGGTLEHFMFDPIAGMSQYSTESNP